MNYTTEQRSLIEAADSQRGWPAIEGMAMPPEIRGLILDARARVLGIVPIDPEDGEKSLKLAALGRL